MTSDYERILQDNIREYGQGTRHLDFLQRLYADRTHFIFELLQNAEDAHATRVTFALDHHQLVVQHDGRLFDEDDVRGVCGVSASTKEGELTAIGEFGIGFKSVFAYTAAPEVHSGDEHFRIRHYVRPEPAPWLGEPLNGRTLFVFPFNRDDVSPELAHSEISAGLQNLAPVALLFLQHIRDVTFESGSKAVHLARIHDDTEPHQVQLTRRINGRVDLHQYWWTFRRPLDHIGFPDQRVEIAFKRTGPGPDAPVERLRSSPLVAYFPTDKETRLGFLLQAPLRTTPARDNVPERDPDNIELIGEATHLLLDTLEHLRDSGRLGLDVFEALPIDAEAFPENGMLRPLFDVLREALRTRPLLPTAGDAGYVSASEVRLARGGGIRGLLSAAQLGTLAGAPGLLHWQPAQLTKERTRTLWEYLRQDVGVEEITPEWVVGHLDADFLQDADDSWLIQLYAFLEQSPALWRAPRGTWDQPGPARSVPLVRLQDGHQVTPFDPDGRPNAYLPGPAPSDYPTVRRTIVTNRTARSFLAALGLQEPDAVDEVIEKILPRYAPATAVVDEEQYGRDLAVITRALQVASGQRRATLIEQLQSAPFVLANNPSQPTYAYHTPVECYWPDDELEHYFQPCPNAWFVHERYAAYHRNLTELGVAKHVRLQDRPVTSSGHVTLLDSWGEHHRGLNGFDPNLRIPGLDAALANPDPRRSAYVWNRILTPYADRLRGTVESSSRQDYTNSNRQERDTEPYRLATDRAWLPAPDGRYATPRELALDQLPADFVRHRGLADTLGMITSVVQQASTQLGIPLELLLYLAENPDALADVGRRAAENADADAVSAPVPGMSPTDFAAQLQDAFAKQAGNGQASEDEDWSPDRGQVSVPNMRRERTAAAIRDAQATEPAVHDRVRLLPRKVWDEKNPAVRQFLLEQYAGRCQVCTATFLKRDGAPYFEVLYLVSHTSAAWVDRPGDVLCLCPTCASKFLHGEVHAADVLDQIRSWRTQTEGGTSPGLQLMLCGEPKRIAYSEKHLLDLQTMVALGEAT